MRISFRSPAICIYTFLAFSIVPNAEAQTDPVLGPTQGEVSAHSFLNELEQKTGPRAEVVLGVESAEEPTRATLAEWIEKNLSPDHQETLKSEIPNFEALASTVQVVTTPDQKLIVVGDPKAHSYEVLGLIGAQVGLYYPVSIEALAELRRDRGPLAALNLRYSPSAKQTSFRLSADYHIAYRPFYVGGHIVHTDLRPRSSPYFDPKFDSVWGAGPQAGARKFFGRKERWLGTIEVGSTWILSTLYTMPMTFHVSVGIFYRFGKKKVK